MNPKESGKKMQNLNDLSIESLLAEIQEEEKNVIGQSGHDVYLLKTLIRFSTLWVKLSEQANEATQENINLQRKVVKLTWALFWLTLALFFFGIVQIALPFFKQPCITTCITK